jgi:hypothetical protein
VTRAFFAAFHPKFSLNIASHLLDNQQRMKECSMKTAILITRCGSSLFFCISFQGDCCWVEKAKKAKERARLIAKNISAASMYMLILLKGSKSL